MVNVPTRSIHELLIEEQSLLDEIADGQPLGLEADGSDRAILRTEMLEIWFGRGRGNDLSGSYIKLRHPPEGIEADGDSSLWAKFIGLDEAPVSRDSKGWVQVDPTEQIKKELALIVRLQREIFSDSMATRNAAFFVEGYTVAYNDWAKGEL